MRRPAGNRAHCACRWPLPRQGRWACSALYPFGAPRWGCPWRVPSASFLGCVRCGGWRVCTRSLTRPVVRTVRHSTWESVGARGCFVWTPTPPLLSRGTPRTGPVRVCVCSLFLVGSGGLASWAHFGVPHLSCGRSVLLLCLDPSGLGLPFSCPFVWPPPFSFLFLPLGLLGLVFVSFHPAFPLSPASSFFLPAFSESNPPLCLFRGLSAARRSVLLCLWSCLRAALFALCSALLFGSAVPCAVLCCAPRCGAVPRCVVLFLCCVVFFRLFACCVAFGHCLSPRGPVLLGAVFCGFPPHCVLCTVPVVPWCVGAWCCLLLCSVLCVCAVCVLRCGAARSLSSQLCAVLCRAVLVRLLCAVHVVCAVCGAWCCGALLCVVLCPLVFSGAVLGLVARVCPFVACFVFCGALLWCGALLSCSAVFFLCCLCLFFLLLCPVVLCFLVELCCWVVLCVVLCFVCLCTFANFKM